MGGGGGMPTKTGNTHRLFFSFSPFRNSLPSSESPFFPSLSLSLFMSMTQIPLLFLPIPGNPPPIPSVLTSRPEGLKKTSFSFYPFFRFPASCVAKFEEGKLQAKLSFFKVVGSNFPLLPLPLSILIWCRAAAVAPHKVKKGEIT